MAANAVIGSLRVNLGMDSAEFQNGAKRAQSTLGTLGASIKAFAAGAVAALSLGAVTAALKSSVDHMDELGKAAQKIGIPVEQLSGLEYAARLADVSLDDLQTSMGRFNKNLAEAASGKNTDFAAALKAIGVSAVDANGQLRPTMATFSDIAQSLSGYADGAEKAALSQIFFGKSGANLIPLLNAGRDGIKEATDEALKFGLVTSEQAAKAAEQFNDNLTRMKAAGEGVTNQIAAGMLPAMNNIVDALFNSVGASDVFVNAGKAIGRVLETMAAGFVALGAAVKVQMKLVAGFALAAQAALKGDFERAGAWMNAMFDSAYDDAKSAMERIRGLFENGGGLEVTVAKKPAPVVFTGSTGAGNSKKSNADDEIKKTTKSLYDMDLGMQRVAKTAEQANNAFGDVVRNNMRSWIDEIMNGTFKLSDALKGLLADFTNLALNNVFAALGGGGGNALYGGGGGLGGFLGGLFGFAKGGTIMPGGSGGIDSQLVAFRKSPNERVDITKPGQTLHSGSETKIVINNNAGVDIRPSRGKDGSFRFDVNRAVSDALSSGGADGAMGARFGVPPSRVRR